MNIDIIRAQEIAIDNLVPNTWNTNKVELDGGQEALDASIDEFRQYKDLVVRPHPELADKYEILGGEHRFERLKDRGEETVFCTIMKGLSEDQAKRLSLADNGRYWEDDPEQLEILLLSLEEGDTLMMLPPDLLILDEGDFDDTPPDPGNAEEGGGGTGDRGDGEGSEYIFSAILSRDEYLRIHAIKTRWGVRRDENFIKKVIERLEEGKGDE